jgi:uncharacterized protein
MIEKRLIDRILDGYALSPMGTHGLPHWGRVLETGLRLAASTGADIQVVELFAVFHDSRRVNDRVDRGHGKRGAELARELRREFLKIENNAFDLLVYACERHTDGLKEGDVTVQTCWDSDRLDLWRANIQPKASFLCTDAAKEQKTIDWSRERSLSEFTPSFVTEQWTNNG